MKSLILPIFLLISVIVYADKPNSFETDVINTSMGKISLTFIGHGTLIVNYKGVCIHVDPWQKLADYATLPKADLILITHSHPDHLDTVAISKISKRNTKIILNADCYSIIQKGIVLKNGDIKAIDGITVEAVPAYNTTSGRENFHPKGRDNGYILTIAKKRIYIAGDTENTPEMEALKNIDIAFLPMNQPYTMVPEQVASAAQKFAPKILYPYHFGETDVTILQKLLENNKNIELRIRKMK